VSTVNLTPAVDVRRAADRFKSNFGWLDSKHSFSFGHHYDHGNTHHGLLLVNNDDIVTPGMGFETHPHRDMEIVTWVLRGSLVHQDSTGHNGVIYPGLAQRMSAGSGIRHSEKNDAGEPVRYVQMWVRPDELDLVPSYQQAEVDDALATGELMPIASGLAKHATSAAIRINQSQAGLYAARLAPDASVHLPQAPYVHLFVALGTITLEGAGPLGTADAARLLASDGPRITAGPDGAEVLVWEMRG
jgi:redox-sensitive bicupin YhaK (pirin superfamily)